MVLKLKRKNKFRSAEKRNMFEYQYAILHYQKHEPQETNEKAEYVSETACLNIAIENPQVPSLEFFDHEILKIRY